MLRCRQCYRFALQRRLYTTIETTLNTLPLLHSADDYSNVVKMHFKQLDEGAKNADDLYKLSRGLIEAMEKNKGLSLDDQGVILNEIIDKFARYNFAAANSAFRKLSEGSKEMNPGSIAELIKYNPGRVKSSWELFNELASGTSSDTIRAVVLEKLIHGDAIDIKEGAGKVDLDRAIKVYQILGGEVNVTLIREESMKKLAAELLDLDLGKCLTLLPLSPDTVKTILSERKEELGNSECFYLYESMRKFEEEIPSDLLLKFFLPISELQVTGMKESENFGKLQDATGLNVGHLPSLADVTTEIRSEIRKRKLDDTTRVKLDLVKSSGFHSADLASASAYIEEFRPLLKGTDTEDLECTQSLIFEYTAINEEKSELLESAQNAAPDTQRASNLSSYVLHNSWFGHGDEAVELYNKYLDMFMEPKEDAANAKSRGMLVQSLILSTLLEDEIGLARFIKLRSTENKLMDDEYDIRVNEIFKQYGDIKDEYKQDAKGKRQALKKLFLKAIADMAP